MLARVLSSSTLVCNSLVLLSGVTLGCHSLVSLSSVTHWCHTLVTLSCVTRKINNFILRLPLCNLWLGFHSWPLNFLAVERNCRLCLSGHSWTNFIVWWLDIIFSGFRWQLSWFPYVCQTKYFYAFLVVSFFVFLVFSIGAGVSYPDFHMSTTIVLLVFVLFFIFLVFSICAGGSYPDFHTSAKIVFISFCFVFSF